MVHQDRWSFVAVVSQNRFHCMKITTHKTYQSEKTKYEYECAKIVRSALTSSLGRECYGGI